MSITQNVNLNMIRGDTLSIGVEFTNLTDDLDGAYFSCKQSYSANSYIFQKSLATGGGITKESTGVYRIRVAPADTENVAPGNYVYDLQIQIDNDILTILIGTLTIGYGVTEGVYSASASDTSPSLT